MIASIEPCSILIDPVTKSLTVGALYSLMR
jgi:hypothetical protein